MSHNVQDYLVNIKSFQTYLDHIVSSIESERYHEDTIKRLSDLITLYYKNVNEEDDSNDDVEFIESDTSMQGTKDNEETSDDSDSDSDSDASGEDYSNIFMSSSTSKQKSPVSNITDKYLTEFTSQTIDNGELHFYKKYPEFVTRLDNFITNANEY